MDKLVTKLQEINLDCKFAEQIIEKKYNESNFLLSPREKTNKYSNFLFCIFDNYDIIVANTPFSDKKMVFNQRVSEVLSLIDEEPANYYDKFNYNEKIMKKNKIQQNIQLAFKGVRNISSLYFLNDLYKTHFIIVDPSRKEFYKTCIKDYPKKYLIFDGKYILQDTLPDHYKESVQTSWNEDILQKNVYKNFLKPISNYKVDELKKIAIEHNISIQENNKIMKKQDIYNKINLQMLQ